MIDVCTTCFVTNRYGRRHSRLSNGYGTGLKYGLSLERTGLGLDYRCGEGYGYNAII